MKKILDGSAIGEVMLQDGVGVREVQEAEIEAKVVPFYREMAAVLGPGQRLWGNVECLEHRDGNDFPVTDFARFATQRRAVGQVVQKLVTFEFFHYMNPFGHLMSNAEYIQAEKSLYDAYRQEVVGHGGGAQ